MLLKYPGVAKALALCVKVKVKLLSHVQLFATPWTVAHQAPPSMGFSRQEYWSGLSFPSPGDLPKPGIEPGSPTLQADYHLSHRDYVYTHLNLLNWQRTSEKKQREPNAKCLCHCSHFVASLYLMIISVSPSASPPGNMSHKDREEEACPSPEATSKLSSCLRPQMPPRPASCELETSAL